MQSFSVITLPVELRDRLQHRQLRQTLKDMAVLKVLMHVMCYWYTNAQFTLYYYREYHPQYYTANN